MTINDLDNLIKRMQLYQKWRRGDTDEWNSDPTLLGKDIDAVIGVCVKVRDFLENTSEKNSASEFEDFEKVESVLDEDDGNHFF